MLKRRVGRQGLSPKVGTELRCVLGGYSLHIGDPHVVDQGGLRTPVPASKWGSPETPVPDSAMHLLRLGQSFAVAKSAGFGRDRITHLSTPPPLRRMGPKREDVRCLLVLQPGLQARPPKIEQRHRHSGSTPACLRLPTVR